MPRITVEGVGDVQADVGCNLLEALEDADVDIEAACGGFAACNSCRVAVISGELTPVRDEETPFLDRPDQRLACQAEVVGDLELRLDPGME